MTDPFDLPPDVLRRIPLFAEISKVLSWTGGPVNWDLARQIAASIAGGEQPSQPAGPAEHEQVAEHVRLAELWLTETTGLSAPTHLVPVRAATPPEWAEHAATVFAELIDPVAAKATRALAEQVSRMTGEQEAGMLAQALRQMTPLFTGIQIGTILGNLAREVTGAHEVSLPASDGAVLLVVPTIDTIASEYQIDRRQVRQWVALQATAYRMVFEGSAWVRTHFFALYHNYVASIDIDIAEGIEQIGGLDFSDPQRLQEAFGQEGVFSHKPSPATAQAAQRVGTFLSIIDAHTAAAAEAAGQRTGDAGRIAETFARRTVEGARGARMLSEFIGLEPSAERRTATRFVRTVLDRQGWQTLNLLWEEPDYVPTIEELAEPNQWLGRVAP
jgi:putative hydrolase